MGLILCCVYYSCCCCICCPPDGPTQTQQHNRTYDTKVVRRNQQQTEPLLVGNRVEEAVIDGVLVRKNIVSVAGLTQSGKVQVVEKQQIIATDGTQAVVRESTRVYKPNV
eukprot:TRINITY_DN1770_c0_g1_i1.p1 TRINITY_DN1770_c0_g1~~TRINITY_DN1770_c0_g1_i1.p1  ORF type:complete len:110 (-),score=15.28 TRINITY_DN1770_c0_g1_i1:176-505(-)